MHHIMKLQPGPFDRIADGSKTIELRLYDEKRKAISIGDTITFTREPEQQQQITVKVVALLHYPTFKDLLADFPPDYFGGADREALLDEVHCFYSLEDQQPNGVLGIKIALV